MTPFTVSEMMRILNRRVLSFRPICCAQIRHNIRPIHRNLTAANEDDKYAILDREILRPERAETCQSGTDDEVARHKSPYDPTKTTVEQEVSALREEYRMEGDMHDPLAVSPANQDVSHILRLEEELGMHEWHPLRSVKGWTSKHKEVLLRKEPYAFRAYEVVFPDNGKYRKVRITSELVSK